MNDLDVKAADIENSYLQALSSETNYVIYCTKFGIENIDKVYLIHLALYGGKSSGADFWKHFWSFMMHLCFTSCKSDTDIWMREAQKDDHTPIWEYVLLYVEYDLNISNRGEDVIIK